MPVKDLGKVTGNVNDVYLAGTQLKPDASGKVTIPGNTAGGVPILDAEGKLLSTVVPTTCKPSRNFEYGGDNLKTYFGTAANLHSAVAAADFKHIKIGDYWPVTLNGTVHDYAENVDRTLSNAVFNLEVMPNFYVNYGDTATPPNHLLMCSRDLLPWALHYRSDNATWYNTATNNPWCGSALWQTLNAPTNGVIARLLASELGPYVYEGPNGNGMRYLNEVKAAAAASATSWAWFDRGKLFLPTEREVWGQDQWSEHTWGPAALQWPIFRDSLRHVVKGLGNGGSRYSWWTASSQSASASGFVLVHSYGHSYTYSAVQAGIGAPLCFLFV